MSMAKNSGRYCVVYNSSTVGKKSYLADRFAKREDAEREVKARNRMVGMGGFFSAHECSKLSWEAKRTFGLLPKIKEGDEVRFLGGYGERYVVLAILNDKAIISSLRSKDTETAPLADLWKM
jgi:hypothetical protein